MPITIRPHRLRAVHGCVLLQMSHVSWSVCLCVCGYTCELCKKRLNRSRCRLRGSRSPREGALLRGHVLAHCNVPKHGCIAHCSPAPAGECACLRRRRTSAFASSNGNKMAMAIWPISLVTCYYLLAVLWSNRWGLVTSRCHRWLLLLLRRWRVSTVLDVCRSSIVSRVLAMSNLRTAKSADGKVSATERHALPAGGRHWTESVRSVTSAAASSIVARSFRAVDRRPTTTQLALM